jgi:putative flippase GtrA
MWLANERQVGARRVRREDRMRDSKTSDSRQASLSADELDEARWMETTLKTRATYPGVDTITDNLRGELAPAQSYYDTRWPWLNQILATTENVTHGKAGVLQRLFTYLIIGGTAAVVNLILFAIFNHYGTTSTLSFYAIVANIVVYGVSILANFIPNDYFTFSHLEGHNRSWLARCLRFYTTSLSGVVVTILLHALFYNALHVQTFIAQVIALILAVIYNFIVHHIFTYANTH